MFWKRKKNSQKAYDKTGKIPVIRASICTGEQVAGFKSIQTGKFTEIMLIRDRRDLEEFMAAYGVAAEEITKEW